MIVNVIVCTQPVSIYAGKPNTSLCCTAYKKLDDAEDRVLKFEKLAQPGTTYHIETLLLE